MKDSEALVFNVCVDCDRQVVMDGWGCVASYVDHVKPRSPSVKCVDRWMCRCVVTVRNLRALLTVLTA